MSWLGERSGEEVSPPNVVSELEEPVDAPGTYVFDK